MNETSNTDSAELDLEKNFVHCLIENSFYIAGDRIKGEVYLNVITDLHPSKLVICSNGTESVMVKKPNNEELSYTNDIFHMNTTLKVWEDLTPTGQYIFPFTFKLPYYAPASFYFKGLDHENNTLEAKVTYDLNIELTLENQVYLSDSLPITIFNNKARSFPSTSTILSNLTTCCCIHKGNSQVSLKQTEPKNPNFGEVVSFTSNVDWKHSKGQIYDIQGSIVHRLQLQIPGDKTYEFSLRIPNSKPNSIFSANGDEIICSTEFEVPLEGDIPSNISSNSSAMISSEYIAEAFVHYRLGIYTRRSEISVFVHVNPRVVENKNFVIPEKWEPISNSLRNVVLTSRKGESIFSPCKLSFGIS